jgi:hypothetical protein
MERAAQLAAAVARRSVKEIPGLAEAMTAHAEAMEALERLPFIDAEKRRRRAEAEAELRQLVSVLIEAARTNALRPYDREEGQLRARARATGADASEAQVRAQVFQGERARQLAALADRATTPAAVRRVYDEALMTEDPEAIRLTGLAAQQRLSALAAADRGRDTSPLRDAALRFQSTFERWEREHPTPTQRLAEIERLRGNAAIEFDASAAFAMRLFGIGADRPAPTLEPVPDIEPAQSGMRIGPGFDQIAGR